MNFLLSADRTTEIQASISSDAAGSRESEGDSPINNKAGKRMMRRKVEDDDAAVSEKIVFPPPRPKITEQEQQLASKRDIIEIGGAKPRESNMESVVARRLASSEPPPEHRHLDEMKGSKATSQALQAATVYCLTTEPLGTFQISKATTLAELRRQIEHEATSRGEKRKSFAFYDLQTKQRIQNESHQRVSKLPAVIVTDRDRTLDSLLAQSTIQGDKAIKVGKNTMSFQLVWYEPIYKTFHPVVLHFTETRISVHAGGGAFNLFDVKTLRVPVVIRPVAGSKKAFQFAQHDESTRVSQFYAARNTIRQAVFVYFCFIWRPRAVRKGFLPASKADLTIDLSEYEPKQFAEQLKTHAKEVATIVQQIESTDDPNVAKAYLALFFHMFNGMEQPLSEGDAISNESLERSPHRHMREAPPADLPEEIKQKKKIFSPNKEGSPRDDLRRTQRLSSDAVFNELFQPVADPLYLEETEATLLHPSMLDVALGLADSASGIPAPPPPPPPPPPATGGGKTLTTILPVNFDSISAVKAPGTIWEEVSTFALPDHAYASLKEDLQRVFGSKSRNGTLKSGKTQASSFDAFEEKIDVIEPNRLRNVEVLLHMDELKALSVDDLIAAFKSVDPRLFNYSVLERLTRMIGTGESRTFIILPSGPEITQLNEFEEFCKKRGVSPTALLEGRQGELLFYRLVKEIPDRQERLSFCYFIEKFQLERDPVEREIQVVLRAVEATCSSETFKKVLRIVFEVLNLLNPKHGLSRGFQISSFFAKIDRMSGVREVLASDMPADKQPASPNPKFGIGGRNSTLRNRLKSLQGKPTNGDPEDGSPSVPAQESNLTEIKASQKVLLFEYLASYVEKFPECDGFWTEVRACEEAQMVDILSLEQRSMAWISKLEEIRQFLQANCNLEEDDPLRKKLNAFSAQASDIEQLRRSVLYAKERTEFLWGYLGETIDTEPQTIFRYVFAFVSSFESFYKEKKRTQPTPTVSPAVSTAVPPSSPKIALENKI